MLNKLCVFYSYTSVKICKDNKIQWIFLDIYENFGVTLKSNTFKNKLITMGMS